MIQKTKGLLRRVRCAGHKELLNAVLDLQTNVMNLTVIALKLQNDFNQLFKKVEKGE